MWVADAVISLLEILAKTLSSRPKARLWAPKSLRSLWKVLQMKGENSTTLFRGDPSPIDPTVSELSREPGISIPGSCTDGMQSMIQIAGLPQTRFSTLEHFYTNIINGLRHHKLLYVYN